MDPLTTIIITAIVHGAAAALKPTTEQAVKDAYAAFKQILKDRYQSSKELVSAVEDLEKKPKDTERQIAVQQQLEKSGAINDPILLESANVIHLISEAKTSRKNILGARIQRKLDQVKALENQIDLTIDEGQKAILKEKAKILWLEISELEDELVKMT